MSRMHRALRFQEAEHGNDNTESTGNDLQPLRDAVAKALKAVPGVQDAKVDLQKAEAVVSYDEAKVSPEKLSVAVVEAGYKVGWTHCCILTRRCSASILFSDFSSGFLVETSTAMQRGPWTP